MSLHPSPTYMYHKVMVLNATFNNISVISWRSVLSVVCGGNRSTRRKPPICHKSLTTLITRPQERDSKPQGTDYISSDQSNYHTITTTTVPMRHKRPNYCSNIYRELRLLLYIQLLSTNLHVWKRNQALI